MDFALTDEQESFGELARQILTDGCGKERLIEIEPRIGEHEVLIRTRRPHCEAKRQPPCKASAR